MHTAPRKNAEEILRAALVDESLGLGIRFLLKDSKLLTQEIVYPDEESRIITVNLILNPLSLGVKGENTRRSVHGPDTDAQCFVQVGRILAQLIMSIADEESRGQLVVKDRISEIDRGRAQFSSVTIIPRKAQWDMFSIHADGHLVLGRVGVGDRPILREDLPFRAERVFTPHFILLQGIESEHRKNRIEQQSRIALDVFPRQAEGLEDVYAHRAERLDAGEQLNHANFCP